MLQRRLFSNSPIVAIVNSDRCETWTSDALARLGTPSAGAVCRAAEIPRLRSRFVDGPLPLACEGLCITAA